MSSATLYRWSGIILLIGSLLGVIGSILDKVLYLGHEPTPQQILSTPFLIDASLFLAWSLLVAMALPGLYLRQAARAGVLGFAGFVLLSLGVLLAGVGFATVQLTIYPYLAQSAPKLLPSGGTGPLAGFLLWWFVPGLLLSVGGILLGIATLRSRVFPRWTGILLFAPVLGVATVLPLPSPFGDLIGLATNVALFVALAGVGSSLVAREKEPVVGAERSMPVAQTGQ